MRQYIARRLLLSFIVIFLVATMVFGALRIDPDQIVTRRAQGCFLNTIGSDPEDCRRVAREELGLDSSFFAQYGRFMSDFVQLDLGDSFYTKEPVLREIKDRAIPSIELGLLQILVALAVGIPVGVVSAIRQDTWMDYILRFFALFFLGIPAFVVAVLVIIGNARFGSGTPLAEWFGPTGSWSQIWEDPLQNLKAVSGAALIGGLDTGAIIMRFLRSQMLEVMRQDYIRTAWAKGLRERVIVIRHALRNSLIPVLTIVGILIGSIVSGNVVLETLFNIPGVGFYVTASVLQFDYPVTQAIVLVVAVTIVFVNLTVDLAYGWLDPRIRYS